MDIFWPCWKCKAGGHPFVGRISEYDLHNSRFHSADLIRCESCPNRFFSVAEKSLHLREDHVKEVCLQCAVNPGTMEFLYEHQFAGHYRCLHKNAKQECPACPNKFVLESTRDDHKLAWHGLGAAPPSIVCLSCKKHREFPTKKALDAHNADVHKSHKHICENCHNAFKHAATCQEHETGCDTKYA